MAGCGGNCAGDRGLCDAGSGVLEGVVSIHMKRKVQVDGLTLPLSRSILGWVAIFGKDYIVYFKQNSSGKWIVRRPRALEPIAVTDTLDTALVIANRHWKEVRAPEERT
jgi:hypothetical protein